MATTTRYPVAIWQDRAGMYTGRLLDDDEDGVAVSLSRRTVMKQLGEYIIHLHETRGHWFDPEFKQPKLRHLKFKIYPEYRSGEKTFASKDPVVLKLPCVTGERESGLFTALLPTVNVAFEFHDVRSFSKLAAHYVRSHANGQTPQQLSRFLPPSSIELDEVVVTLKEVKEREFDAADVEELSKIADPVTSRERGRTNRTWERDQEVSTLADWLTDDKGHICLVGPSGCGKSSVLAEAAKRVEAALPPSARYRKGEEPPRFWLTSAGRIVAGMAFLGQWEQRLEDAIEELSQIRGVLCVTNLLELLRLGGAGPESSIAAFLIPALQDGSLRLVAEATAEELEACDRLLPGILDELRLLQLEPFSEEASLSLLSKAVYHLSQSESRPFEDGSAETTYGLFQRFQPYAAFPGRAVDFLTKASEQARETDQVTIGPEFLRQQFAQATGLPLTFVSETSAFDPQALTARLTEQIIGQSPAVQTMTQCLTRFKAGLNDPRRPLGVYLFCGPTGVGKTALVRAVSDELFGNLPAKDRLIRLDMSEYARYDATARLLGNPHGEPSELIRKLRAQPFSVVLLDEIEKASDEIFDVFLNVFEEGRLTDAFGRVTSFQSTIIIMTSNLGAEGMKTMSFEPDAVTTDRGAIKRFFRPEFFNRLDDVIYFQALNKETIREVTRKELQEISDREGFRARQLVLAFEDSLIDELASQGYDPKLGARPLQRKIEEQVTAKLALYLLEHPGLRETRLVLSWHDDSVRIKAS